jgi:ribonuclease BN (tRNA processing enzyme)
MRLTTIGTGTAAPHPYRVCAGHLLEARDVRLLLDCGSGVVHRMASFGINWGAITHIALTHFDADHISDLATMFIAWRYGQLPSRRAPVTVLGPVGTRGVIERLAAALWERLLTDPGYPVRIQELAADEDCELGPGVRLATRKVPHTPESIAYAVTSGGRRLVYTGDTAYDVGLAEWARRCDVLLCECSLPATLAVATHLTPEQCGALAKLAQPKLLVLTHFYPPVEWMDIRAVVAGEYSGMIVLATDGWHYEIEGS